MSGLPAQLNSESELDELLTRPSARLREYITRLQSPLILLGAGGKMGPTLAVLAKRAAAERDHPLEVLAVSRFSDPGSRAWLENHGIRTMPCDLLDRSAVAQLPWSENVISLAGLKFGTSRDPAATWATNTLVPANIAEHFAGSRIVALSTGNVYPLSLAAEGGSREDAPLIPLGEYPNAAVARERIFEFCARKSGAALALIRLFYAVEMRYGVLVDLATKVAQGQEIDLRNGFFNCIWQGDANEMILRATTLCSAPPSAWNLCSPEVYSVRETALELGRLLGIEPVFVQEPSATALLGNAEKITAALGRPALPIEPLLRWTAEWVRRGGRNLGRPTHFEVRTGVY